MYVQSGSSGNVTSTSTTSYDTPAQPRSSGSTSPASAERRSTGRRAARSSPTGLRNVLGFNRDAMGRMYGVQNGQDDVTLRRRRRSQRQPGRGHRAARGRDRTTATRSASSPSAITSITPGTQVRSEIFPGNTRDDAWCQNTDQRRPAGDVRAGALGADRHHLLHAVPRAACPEKWRNGAFVSLHGSWNRDTARPATTSSGCRSTPTERRRCRPTAAPRTTFPYEVVLSGGSASGPRDGAWNVIGRRAERAAGRRRGLAGRRRALHLVRLAGLRLPRRPDAMIPAAGARRSRCRGRRRRGAAPPPGGRADRGHARGDAAGRAGQRYAARRRRQQVQSCHAGGLDDDGKTFRPWDTWSGTMMANATRDPLFLAALTVSEQDAPGSGAYCLRCHTPKGLRQGTRHRRRRRAGRGRQPGRRLRGLPPLDRRVGRAARGAHDGATIAALAALDAQAPYIGNARLFWDPRDVRHGPYDDADSPAHAAAGRPFGEQLRAVRAVPRGAEPAAQPAGRERRRTPGFRSRSTTRTRSGRRPTTRGPGTTKSCVDCHMPAARGDALTVSTFPSAMSRTNPRMHLFVGGNEWGLEAVKLAAPDVGRRSAPRPSTATAAAVQAMLAERGAHRASRPERRGGRDHAWMSRCA